MEDERMTAEEKRDSLLETYAMLQEIKAAEKGENPVLDYKIKLTTARLSTLGVNVTELEL